MSGKEIENTNIYDNDTFMLLDSDATQEVLNYIDENFTCDYKTSPGQYVSDNHWMLTITNKHNDELKQVFHVWPLGDTTLEHHKHVWQRVVCQVVIDYYRHKLTFKGIADFYIFKLVDGREVHLSYKQKHDLMSKQHDLISKLVNRREVPSSFPNRKDLMDKLLTPKQSRKIADMLSNKD